MQGTIANGLYRTASSPNELALLEAAKVGDTPRIAALQAMGVNLNVHDPRSGNTALHEAIQNGYIKTATYLLTQGADANAPGDNNLRPLDFAAFYGIQQIVLPLLEHGADVTTGRYGTTPLMIASQKGYLTIVKLLVGRGGSDVNAQENSRNTALHEASERGHTEIVRYLLEQGANRSIRGYQKKLPIDLARERGHQDTVDVLSVGRSFVLPGRQPGQGAQGSGPLGAGAGPGPSSLQAPVQPQMVYKKKFLPKAGVWTVELVPATQTQAPPSSSLALPISGQGSSSGLALPISRQGPRSGLALPISRQSSSSGLALPTSPLGLAPAPPPPGPSGKMPLIDAIEANDPSQVYTLLANGEDPNQRNPDGFTALYIAASLDNDMIVRYLLLFGARVDEKVLGDQTPLFVASQMGSPRVVAELLRANPDVNAVSHGTTPLIAAARSGNMAVVRLLLEAGADVNARPNGRTSVLNNTKLRNNQELLQLLKNFGATNLSNTPPPQPPNTPSPPQPPNTPPPPPPPTLSAPPIFPLPTPTLFNAIKAGNLGLLETLVKNRGSLNEKDTYGSTPLYLATAMDNEDLVRILLAAGANPNLTNRGGTTPLHYTGITGNTRIAQLLIEKGADVNARDKTNQTPLHVASFHGKNTVVELLLANGADPSLTNTNGRKASDIARNKGRRNVGSTLYTTNLINVENALPENEASDEFEEDLHLLKRITNASSVFTTANKFLQRPSIQRSKAKTQKVRNTAINKLLELARASPNNTSLRNNIYSKVTQLYEKVKGIHPEGLTVKMTRKNAKIYYTKQMIRANSLSELERLYETAKEKFKNNNSYLKNIKIAYTATKEKITEEVNELLQSIQQTMNSAETLNQLDSLYESAQRNLEMNEDALQALKNAYITIRSRPQFQEAIQPPYNNTEINVNNEGESNTINVSEFEKALQALRDVNPSTPARVKAVLGSAIEESNGRLSRFQTQKLRNQAIQTLLNYRSQLSNTNRNQRDTVNDQINRIYKMVPLKKGTARKTRRAAKENYTSRMMNARSKNELDYLYQKTQTTFQNNPTYLRNMKVVYNSMKEAKGW